ncbi:phage antirepressor [Jeotgalibacillus proteolyticus]|uniref:Phage repressor protein/antirepressor Ant n=1 Tax=Jeotgalibacillus proteolyticus TaxID=2082395 RepID=A0A2S5GAL5_9BACL|nr:phage antirepressor KilAC domain-containing protein [Jeotgalibacillus proteolyticus]PPA70077.1 phage repressor protein/antirepressor Ant [Jeotgalibacillus proteolyticus]
MNSITKVFNGTELRIIDQNNEPWFVAADVCKVLDIKNVTQALGRLDQDERSMLNIGRQGLTNLVNEQGLYELIFASRKYEAKIFKRWIKSEVLPSIRKHGAYATPETLDRMLADPDNMIKILTTLKEERTAKETAQRQIVQDRPKVVFAESLEVSPDTILIKELANLLRQKGVNTGEKRLYEWMREKGYLCKKVGGMYNLPTQKSLDLGLFEIKKGVRSSTSGEMKQTKTTKVTGKGQIYFINKFLGNQKII